MAQASISSLGPFVRLEGISITQLPPGGHGLSPSKSHETDTTKADQSTESLKALDLQTFAARVLGEALPFIDSVAPKSRGSSSWKAKGTPKTFSSSEAPVHLYERTVSGKDLDQIEGMSHFSADRRDETWFCRKSCHENKADKGTASWDEFVRSFKLHHADSEMAFTPTVIGARKAIDWPVLKNDIEVHGGRWTDIIVVVEEMKHKITPKPLKNRTFPVIQISATLKYTQEFLVVSIPLIDFEKSPYAEYAKDKSLVVAAYTSIERVRVLPENGDIEWIMATASDAKGVLPIWMQNLAVPTAVAKDVDFFMSVSTPSNNLSPAASSTFLKLDKTMLTRLCSGYQVKEVKVISHLQSQSPSMKKQCLHQSQSLQMEHKRLHLQFRRLNPLRRPLQSQRMKHKPHLLLSRRQHPRSRKKLEHLIRQRLNS